MSDLILEQIPVGPMQNFAYLIGSKSAKSCVVVDPAWDLDAIREKAEERDLKVTGALVTHYHPDHCGGHLWGHDIAGVAEVVEEFSVPVYSHVDEYQGLRKVTGLQASDFKQVRSGEDIELGGVKIKCIHTPGHTPGSLCFLVEQNLVAGDTLFISGCGRVDLPGGNSDQLYESLSQKLAKLPANTVLYPGHHYDPESSMPLGQVKEKNPYFSVGSLPEWQRIFGPGEGLT